MRARFTVLLIAVAAAVTIQSVASSLASTTTIDKDGIACEKR
jgi:hypothetical protein